MSALDGKSVAEKIVWLFTERVTEAHRAAVEMTLGITEEEFTRAIPRARDIGVEEGIWLTPIYEREGWWTARPTRRLAAIAVRESVKRNLGEAQRNARVYCSNFGEDIADVVNGVKGGMHGLDTLVASVPELHISEEADYILDAIDAADDRRPYIYRESVAA